MIEDIRVQKIESKKTYDTEKYRIRHTDEIPAPDVVLYMNGVMVVTRKSIFALSGKAKSGKTFAIALIVAAVLKKGNEKAFSSYCKKDFDEVVLFDTEQSGYYVHKVIERVKILAGEDKMDKLKCYSIRSVRSDDRANFIKQVVYGCKKNALVIIDGIADLITSVNDDQASIKLVEEVQMWAEDNDVAIGFVLHQNPSQSDKMRGHLGTFGMNKCETVIQVSNTKEKRIKLVDTTQTRNAEPEPFSFEINENGIPIIDEVCYEGQKAGRKIQKQLKDFEKYAILNEIFVGNYKQIGIGYTVLTEKIKEIHVEKHGAIGINALKELVTFCREMNWISQDRPKSNYFLQPFTD